MPEKGFHTRENLTQFFFFLLHTAACGTLVPWPGIEPTTPALEGGVLTTGPTGEVS